MNQSQSGNQHLPIIVEEDDLSYEGSDEGSDEVVQNSVIHHLDDGECCTFPNPRQRLGARSLPGRSIESRTLTVDQPSGMLGARRRSIPGRLVIDGDVIRYFSGYEDDDSEEWLRATVQPMYLTQQRLYPTFYNVLNERGAELSVELLPRERTWQLLDGDTWEFVGDGERRPA